MNPTILLTDDIERDLSFIMQSGPKAKLTLKTHPYVEAFLKKGFPSIQMKWFFRFYKWIKITSENSCPLMEFKFFNETEDEIRLS